MAHSRARREYRGRIALTGFAALISSRLTESTVERPCNRAPVLSEVRATRTEGEVSIEEPWTSLQVIGVRLTPYAWATHILICVCIQALVAGTLRVARISKPWWLGAMLAIGYAWSREKTEFEFVLKGAAGAKSVGAYWYRGFLPFEWAWPSQLEFYAPASAVLLCAWWMQRNSGRAVARFALSDW